MNTDLVHAIATQTMRYPFKVWGFGEGIALEALWQAGEQLAVSAYQQFVQAQFERWLAREPHIVEADHSAPGMLLLDLYESSGDERLWQLAQRLHAHMASLPTDSISGARYHRPQHETFASYLYVDCVEVDAPFLAKLGHVTGNAAYYDEAVQQIEGYAALLQNDVSGLFYHQFDHRTRQTNGAFWGRGNGWALLGLVKTLMLLPTSHAGYSVLRHRLERLIGALSQTQKADGAWSTVLDQPQTYEEASLPAMFSAGITLARQASLVEACYQTVADRAYGWLVTHVTSDGLLQGVSIATPPGNASHYDSISTGTGYPWGQGPLLLATLLNKLHKQHSSA